MNFNCPAQCQTEKLTKQMGNWGKGQVKVAFSRAAWKKENMWIHFGEQLLFLVELLLSCKISPCELLQFLLSLWNGDNGRTRILSL